MSVGDLSPEHYERLALEMLAVEAGDFADVKDAMRKIIASAPEGADIAFLLSRALAHAGDRALTGEAPLSLGWEEGSAQHDHEFLPVRPNEGRGRSGWWAAAATPVLGAAALFWWLGNLALKTDDGTQDAGIAAISMTVISVGFLGAALIGIERWFLLRRQPPSPAAISSGAACPPGWYADPWDQGASRWWDGSHWTGRLRA